MADRVSIFDRFKEGDVYEGRRAAWVPQPRQEEFMRRFEDEVLFGGAAGGGKSDAIVAEALRQIHIPHYKGLILRKTYPQLAEIIEKTYRLYPQIDPKARYNSTSHTWRFSSGAKIIFGSLPHPKDKYNYQGQAYDFIAFDELTHFTWEEYRYLMSRNRPNGPGTRVYMRATANPGGIGHGWVKERFVSPVPPMTTIWESIEVPGENGGKEIRRMSRVFVPSKVEDNYALMRNDPMYRVKLLSLPEAERKALYDGDWDSYVGQVFGEFRNDPDHYLDGKKTHVIEPFDPPKFWRVFRSFDWGYNKPFSVGWWAVDQDGIMYRILEWYGCKEGKQDEGLELDASEVFEGIARMEHEHPYLRGRKIRGVADPAIWQKNGGLSICEEAEKKGVYFDKGDNTRIAGWAQVHERLRFGQDGRPRLYVFNTCRGFIRVFPAAQYDQNKPEDVDTKGEDHICDETRYACMANPVPSRLNEKDENWRINPLNLYLDIKRGDLR